MMAWFFQYFRLGQPNMRVGRNLHNVGFASLVQSIQKRTITTVQFVRRPSHHLDAVAFGPVDQIQGDLRLRFEDDFIRNVVFFRRTGSSAHSRGR